ncbi:MAG TPA: hypothetical protein VFP84_22625, partial [Kofleriaceae bacterium]|nr:hypothetical protein [Kofleriaceae bacterium]
VVSPVVLPPACPAPRSAAADALAADLRAHGVAVEAWPPPVAGDGDLLFPQLAFVERGVAWCIELIGLSTPDRVADRLARYRAAHQPVVLCVEQRFAPGADATPGVHRFTSQVDARDVLAMVRGERRG